MNIKFKYHFNCKYLHHDRILSNKKNLLISILFLIQHNFILSQLVVYKKAYDISHKGSHPHMTPTTNPIILTSQITGYIYFLSHSFNSSSIIIYLYSFIWVLLYISTLLIIGYRIIIRPVICDVKMMGLVVGVIWGCDLRGWCHMPVCTLLSLLLQISAGKLRSYAFWKYR